MRTFLRVAETNAHCKSWAMDRGVGGHLPESCVLSLDSCQIIVSGSNLWGFAADLNGK